MWFEPERVMPGTRLALEHPEWLLKTKDGDAANPDMGLLDLGNARCIDGESLARDGFTIALAPRSGAIWFYQTAHNQGDDL